MWIVFNLDSGSKRNENGQSHISMQMYSRMKRMEGRLGLFLNGLLGGFFT